ncbi:WXG100-like domain-containing protein, partial [Streptomyces mirabilis]
MIASGGRFPKTDEGALSDLAAAHYQAASLVEEAAGGLPGVVGRVAESATGPQGDAMAEYLETLGNSLPDLAASARGVGDLLRQTAVEVQYAKIMIIVTEIWLAEQLIELAFWAPYLIPAVVGAARAVIRLLFQALEKGLLTAVREVLGVAAERTALAWSKIVPLLRAAGVQGLKFGALGAGVDVGLGGLIQLGQMAAGDRQGFSWSSMASGAVMGLVGGGLGGVFHAALASAGSVAKGLGKNDTGMDTAVTSAGKNPADSAGMWGAVKNSVRSAGVADAAGGRTAKGIAAKLGGPGRAGSGRAFVDTPLGQAAVWGPSGYLATEFSNAVYGDSASGSAGFLSGLVGGMAGARLGHISGGDRATGEVNIPAPLNLATFSDDAELDEGGAVSSASGVVPARTSTSPHATETTGTPSTTRTPGPLETAGAEGGGMAAQGGAQPATGARSVNGEGAGSVTGPGAAPASTASVAGSGLSGLPGFESVLPGSHFAGDSPTPTPSVGTDAGAGLGRQAVVLPAGAEVSSSGPVPTAVGAAAHTETAIRTPATAVPVGAGGGAPVSVQGGGVGTAGRVENVAPAPVSGALTPLESDGATGVPVPTTRTTDSVGGVAGLDPVASGGGYAVGAEPRPTVLGPVVPGATALDPTVLGTTMSTDGAKPGVARTEAAAPADVRRAVSSATSPPDSPAAVSGLTPAVGPADAPDVVLSVNAFITDRPVGPETSPTVSLTPASSASTSTSTSASAVEGGFRAGPAVEQDAASATPGTAGAAGASFRPVPGETGRSAVEALTDRLVRERARQGDAGPRSDDFGVPLRRMTLREQQEWVERQVLAQSDGHGTGAGRVREEARQFLKDLHRDLSTSFPLPEGAQHHFAPAHSASESASSHAEQWFGEQSRIAGEREAEFGQAQREAEQQEYLDTGFERWAADRLGRSPSAEPSSLPRFGHGPGTPVPLDGADPGMPGERPGDAVSGESALPHERYGPVVAEVYRSAETRLRQQLDDGGESGLDRWPGLRDFLDRQWVIEHGVEQAGVAIRAAFGQWRNALAPGRRQWLDGWAEPSPRPQSDAARPVRVDRRIEDGDGDGVPSREGTGTRAERMMEGAERALERSVRGEMTRLLTRSALAAGPEPLVRETTRAVAREVLGGRDRPEETTTPPGIREAVERMGRGLRSRVTEVFEQAEADEWARHTAVGEFDTLAGRSGGPTEVPERAADSDRVRELSEGGRERLRREWLAEFDRDRVEIRGELGSPQRSGAGQAEADRRWEEVRADRLRALPDRIELQTAKETAAHAATDAVRETAQTDLWRTALDGPDAVFHQEFGLERRQADMAAQRSAAYGLGSEMHQHVDTWTQASERDPDGLWRIIDDHTLSENVRRRLVATVARRAVEDAARDEAAAMLAARAPGIARDAAERFSDGHIARVTDLFDERFATFTALAPARDNAQSAERTGAPQADRVDAAALDAWRHRRQQLSDGLGRHLAFEIDATAGLGLWAQGTREAAKGRRVRDDEWDRIADMTRRDWFETFHGYFGPRGLDTGDWLNHEATVGGRFARDATLGIPARLDAAGHSTELSLFPDASPRDDEETATRIFPPVPSAHTDAEAVGPLNDTATRSTADHVFQAPRREGESPRASGRPTVFFPTRPWHTPTPATRYDIAPGLRHGSRLEGDTAASVPSRVGVLSRLVVPGEVGRSAGRVAGERGLSAAPLLPRGTRERVELVPPGSSALDDGAERTRLHPDVRVFEDHGEAARWGMGYSAEYLSRLPREVQAAVTAYTRDPDGDEGRSFTLPYDAGFRAINGLLRGEFETALEKSHGRIEPDRFYSGRTGQPTVRSRPVYAGVRVIGVSFQDDARHRMVAGAHELLADATVATHAVVEGGTAPRYRVLGEEDVPVPTGVGRWVIDAEGTPDDRAASAELEYADNWGRYWNIAPLTEEELRRHVARDGRFPDEHVLTSPAPLTRPTPAPSGTTPTDVFGQQPSHLLSRSSAAQGRDTAAALVDGMPGERGWFSAGARGAGPVPGGRAGVLERSGRAEASEPPGRAEGLASGFRRPGTGPVPVPFVPAPGIRSDVLVWWLLRRYGQELGIRSPEAMTRYVLHLA